MDLIEAIRTNAAVRGFTDEPVGDATIFRILDTARFAPSGGNRQGWKVAVVSDPVIRRQIRDLCVLGWREYVAHRNLGVTPLGTGPDGRYHGPALDPVEARAIPAPSPFVDDLDRVPVLLVVAVDLTQLALFDADSGRHSIVGGGSIYPFCHNILLAARAEGLGGVLTTFLLRSEEAARPILHLPDGHGLAAVIALGRPAGVPPTRLTRKPVAAFTTRDTFDGIPFEA